MASWRADSSSAGNISSGPWIGKLHMVEAKQRSEAGAVLRLLHPIGSLLLGLCGSETSTNGDNRAADCGKVTTSESAAPKSDPAPDWTGYENFYENSDCGEVIRV